MSKRNNYLSCLLCAALLFCASGCGAHQHAYTRTIIPPTCNSIGYTINSCSCGDTYYSDYQAKTPHLFGDFLPGEKHATLTEGGEEYRICGICGILETRDTENASALPKLYLTDGTRQNADGEGSSSQTESQATSFALDAEQTTSLLYSDGSKLRFSCTAVLNAAGGTGKQDYTLTLLSDPQTQQAYRVDLGWGERNEYRLCTLSPDATLTRALAAQTLWRVCAGTETDAASRSVVRRTVGSHLVQVYSNGAYRGLYALLPPEDSWFSTLNGTTAAALRTMGTDDGCHFRARPSYDEESGDFRFLGCTTQDTAWARESFSGFSAFVRNSSDTAFKTQLTQYTDLNALFDYFLLLHFFGLQEDTESTVWYTTDGIWRPAFYDLTCTYGLQPDGSLQNGQAGIPQSIDGGIAYDGENLLWERLTAVYAEELQARYAFLRGTVLQDGKPFADFSEAYARMEATLAETELSLNPALNEKAGSLTLIQAYLQKRTDAMDEWLHFTR